MRERTNPAALPQKPTRRQIATGIAMAFCGMAAYSAAFAEQSMKQMPGARRINSAHPCMRISI